MVFRKVTAAEESRLRKLNRKAVGKNVITGEIIKGVDNMVVE